MKRLAVVLGLIFSFGVVGSAQWASKTVTNADLEKYKQKRLQAEQDYRENYAKMGFPSPEELERQLEQSRLENERFSERLAAERIEYEKAVVAAIQAQAQAQAAGTQTVVAIPYETPSQTYSNGYGYGNTYYTYGRRGRYRDYRQKMPSGYVSGGTYWGSGTGSGRRVRTQPR